MKTEEPYYDENGKQIKEFAVIRVFHFIGDRRKKHYMYKWVKLKEFKGQLFWVGHHLCDDNDSINSYYQLRFSADENRVLKGVVIVQQYD